MQEEEAGAARMTGTTSLTLFTGCGLHPLLSFCLGDGNVSWIKLYYCTSTLKKLLGHFFGHSGQFC